jgi:hypothetical protein
VGSGHAGDGAPDGLKPVSWERHRGPAFPRPSAEAPPRWGVTLGRVKRPNGLLVPRVRPAPDGCPSGGTQPTDIRVLNRRRDWFRLFRSTEDHSMTPTSKSCSPRVTSAVISIGIGRGLTASPLPHHRTYGSRIRRFGRFRQGKLHPNRSVVSRRASRAFIPEAKPRPTPRRMLSRRSTPGYDSSRPFGPSHRGGWYDAVCGLLRSGQGGFLRPQSSTTGTPRRAPVVSGHTVRAEAPDVYSTPHCGWRALRSRASSSRASHTSYPVRVPRPARAFHAAFRSHLAVTPWHFPGPSAPRTPGPETCTPKHDRMHGTHARHEPRA